MKLFCAIDIMGGEVVRLTRGEAQTRVAYNPDPVEQARTFEKQGVTHLHLVDLDAAFRRGENREILARIAGSTSARLQVGGGLRRLDAIEALLGSGVWRVVVGSAAVEDPRLIEAAVARFGDRIAVGLDARDGVLKIRGWTETADLTALEAARRMAEVGVRTLIVTDIERDGTLGGPDIEGTVRLARETGCRVVVSGGVSKLADLDKLVAHPERSRIEGVIVGKAIYEGRVDVRQALARLEAA